MIKLTGQKLHLLQGMVFLLLVCLTVLLVWPLQKEMGIRMNRLKENAVHYLEARIGHNISYEKISPSLFRFLEVRKLIVYDQDKAHPLITINKLKVYYDLFRLLSNHLDDAFTAISIENSEITIDSAKDQKLISLIKELITEPREQTLQIPALLGKNLTLTIITPQVELTLKRVFFSLNSDLKMNRIKLKSDIGARFLSPFAGLKYLSSKVQINGNIDAKFKWADVRILVNGLSSNLLAVKRQTLHLNLDKNIWQIRKIQDKAPVDLEFSVDPSKNSANVLFRAEDFRPSSLFSFEEEWKKYNPWLATVISGQGSLEYNYRSGDFHYSGNIKADINNRFVPARVKASALFSGKNQYISLPRLYLSSPLGRLSYAGRIDLKRMLPYGTVNLTDIVLLNGQHLSGRLTLSQQADDLLLKAERLDWGAAEFQDVELVISPGSNRVSYELRSNLKGCADATCVTSEGAWEWGAERSLQISINTNNVPLAKLLGLYDRKYENILHQSLDEVTLSVKLFFTTDFKKYSFSIPEMVLQDRLATDNSVTINAVGNNEKMDIKSQIAWNGYQGNAEILTLLRPGEDIQINTNLLLQGHQYQASALVGKGNLILNGDYGTKLVVKSYKQQLSVFFQSQALPIPYKEKAGSLTIDGEGRYINNRDWELLIRDCSLVNLPLPVHENQLEFSGKFSNNRVDIYSFGYNDVFSQVAGNGRISYDYNQSINGLGWFQLQNRSGEESYDVYVSIENNLINSWINFKNAPVKRFTALPLSGNLSGKCSVIGLLPEPNIQVSLSTDKGFWNNDPFSIRVDIALGKEQLTINTLELEYLSNKIYDTSGSWDFNQGIYALRSRYQRALKKGSIDAGLSLSGTTGKFLQIENIMDTLRESWSGRLDINNIRIDNKKQNPWVINFSRNNDLLFISGSEKGNQEKSLVDVKIFPNGEFEFFSGTALPIACSAQGKITKTTISADFSNLLVDFSKLDPYLEIPSLRLVKGIARGNLKISGALNDPEFNGRLEARGVVATTPFVPYPSNPTAGRIVFSGKNVSIPETAFTVAGVRAKVKVELYLDHWLPQDYDVAFSSSDSKGVPVKSQFVEVSVDGYATGSLRIYGDIQSFNIEGNLVANACTIALEKAQESEPLDEELIMTVDLTVTSGTNVEFVWPSRALPIFKGFADRNQTLKITYNTIADQYSLTGDINIKGGEIFYFKRSFFLREGLISFHENQDKFDPRLTARAEIREINKLGDFIKIFLVVNNQPLSQFNPTFETDDIHTSQEDIYAMLGQSFFDQFGGENISLASAIAGGVDYGTQLAGILKPFEDKVKQIFQLDLFSIRTEVIHTALLDKVLGQDIDPSRYLDNTTLFLGKYVSDDLFLEGVIRLGSNQGIKSDIISYDQFKIDSEINLELKTPLFLLDISFLPDFEDIFATVAATSFTFSWRLLY